MTVMYWTGGFPWWDDNSLSKPSKTMFMNNWGKMSNLSGDGGWVKTPNVVIIDMDYNSATLQLGNWVYPQNNNTYFAINLNNDTSNNQGWWYFFIDTISFDNLASSSTATIRLRLDKWGTCVANLNSDFSTWTTQVLATNKELNLYDFWNKAYNNLSSFTWLTKTYPNLSDIKLIKYFYKQWTYQDDGNSKEMMGNAWWYKIGLVVSTYNDIPTDKKSAVKLEGGIHDYYTQTLNCPTSDNKKKIQITGSLESSNENNPTPFVYFSPVVPYENSQTKYFTDFTKYYTLEYWSLPLLLNISTDKDIGLIALPFCLTNKNLLTALEPNLSGNQLLNTNTEFKNNGDSGGYWTVDAYGYKSGAVLNPDGWNFKALLIDFNGVEINNFYLADVNNWTNDNNFLSLIYKDGFENAIASDPWNFTSLAYCITPAMIMYPMLFNYYSYNISYMGQQVSYTSKYVNNVQNLIPVNANGWTNPLPLNIKFSANYPNLTLNVYAPDNIIGSSNTPIGQINLSTALLPNTTNPEATFETNEKKIINNSATLKNLDTASLWTSYLGGLGINSILNPLSFFANAINVGLDTSKINLNFSNSFGSAKQYQLAHQNTLQTAGDNLGSPCNELTYWMEMPALNDLQNIIGQVDKYGYPYNQWDRFSNLFGNYYHNYIKLSQNADLLVNQNATLLMKDWQNYLIEQFINGVVIWENTMPDGSISFMDTWQFYNDCMYGRYTYGDLQHWDIHYHANFKFNHKANTLINFVPLEQQKTKPSDITPINNLKGWNEKESALNKENRQGGKIGWKKL